MSATQIKSQTTPKKRRKTAKRPKKSAQRAPKKTQPHAFGVELAKVHHGFEKFEPTEDQKNLVILAAAMGYNQEQMVKLIINPKTHEPITEKTLREAFPDELLHGRERVMMKIASTMVSVASDRKHPKCVTAGIFLSKVWGKFREPEPEWSENKRAAALAENAPQEGLVIIEAELVLEEPKPLQLPAPQTLQ